MSITSFFDIYLVIVLRIKYVHVSGLGSSIIIWYFQVNESCFAHCQLIHLHFPLHLNNSVSLVNASESRRGGFRLRVLIRQPFWVCKHSDCLETVEKHYLVES